MKNLKLVMAFTLCFLFAGMQYATAQVKEKVEDIKTTTKEVKQDVSKFNPEDDKRVYRPKTSRAKKIKKAAKKRKVKEKLNKINKKVTIKELDSDEIEELNLEEEDN